MGAVAAVGVAFTEGLGGVQTAAGEVVPLLTAVGVYIVPNHAGRDGDGRVTMAGLERGAP